MGPVSVIFPGQGSFSPGMGKELKNFQEIRQIFDVFNEVSHLQLERYCWGDRAIYTRKNNQLIQLTITAVNLAYARVLSLLDIEMESCLGHSLGEISAVIWSEAVSLSDGARITQKRGELMEMYSRQFPGDMLSIRGLTSKQAEKIINNINKEQGFSLALANLNGPTLLTISGLNEELSFFRHFLIKHEKKLIIKRLEVGGLWHHPVWMKGAAADFAEFLNGISFHPPKKRFFSITRLQFMNDPQSIRKSLSDQLISQVRWRSAIDYLSLNEYQHFVESGPGKILRSLLRYINPQLICQSGDSVINQLRFCSTTLYRVISL